MNSRLDAAHAGQQALIEHEMLRHICNALRVTLDWRIEGGDISRQLSSLCFIVQSLKRHLERMMSLEEHGGYMNEVIDGHPELTVKVESLRAEHDRLKKAVRRLALRLKRLAPTDTDGFVEIQDEIRDYLVSLDDHGATETAIIQEAYLQDEGGSG